MVTSLVALWHVGSFRTKPNLCPLHEQVDSHPLCHQGNQFMSSERQVRILAGDNFYHSMPNGLHMTRVFSGGKKMSLKLRRLKFSLRHSEFPQLQTGHFPGSCDSIQFTSGWLTREAMPAFRTVCSRTSPFLVMKYLQHTREYAMHLT